MMVVQLDPTKPDRRAACWRRRCQAQRARGYRYRGVTIREKFSAYLQLLLALAATRTAAVRSAADWKTAAAVGAAAAGVVKMTMRAVAEHCRSSPSATWPCRRPIPIRWY